MMDIPLTLTHLFERARALFPGSEVVSRLPDKQIRRQTFAETYARTERLARALTRLGIRPGDRIGTLAWNHAPHLECYWGIPAMGASVHTLNLRLHPDELSYIAAHAGDVVVVVDRCLWPLFEKIRERIPSLKHIIVIPDGTGPLPAGALDYEALLEAESCAVHPEGMDIPAGSPFRHPDERTESMVCYTSGTTGNPKGVAYTHRSAVLHALAISMRDLLGIGCDDVVMPVVPMFHAAAWGLPHAAFANGAKIVFPGPHLDGTSLLDLMQAEGVTFAAGVPTIWLGILALLDQHPGRWDLSRMRNMVIGGSAAPPAMIQGFKERHGLDVIHAWGMTEMSPIGTLARVTPAVAARGPEAAFSARTAQGLPVPLVEIRHVDDDGRILSWDGSSMGELEVRGPWVADVYIRGEGKDRFTSDGWFKTGDVVTIDPDGYVRITDRAKDVIKSGGEWISSVALENALMAHPAVLEAAVFAVRHPKWGERPVAAVVCKPNQSVSEDELRALLAGHFSKICLPDAYLFIDQIPRTSTGKFLKQKLRATYGDLLQDSGRTLSR